MIMDVNFIDGNNVALCPINTDHFPLYLKWRNDPNVRKFNCNRFRQTSGPNMLFKKRDWFLEPN